MTPVAVRVLVLVAVVIGYYWLGKTALFKAAGTLAKRTRAKAGKLDVAQRTAVLELAAAGLSHVLLVVLLVLVTGVGPGVVLSGADRPDLLALGALLGVGELALGSLLCRAVIEVSLAARLPARTGAHLGSTEDEQGTGLRSWLGRSRGGWIRHHLVTLKVLPLPVAVLLTGTQVASEETVFRAIALTWLRDAGPAVALSTSIALFVVMQAFFMSSWQAALFPVVGGVVMGIVHGLVFWAVPAVAPLVVAHVVFFFFAVL
ncbi:hypothetical protein H4696_000241 [Amycolatopsis lexingtonensis]|uniref:CAAX prenyl protease 2/Lysostaphin resistance protein A-like domain-containing protein n=1 Tax=Amycolatopsis lexingtonensis TaxID=218822 RepID=A0ABR9HQC7_9PSEU|nr:CPBP family glutamic-type intramembrane protease [Amycolatopsis lexingtonensis]MBE1493141.1 hypothetical protein [Amycolatopsis lexingtonensis]